MLSPFLDNARLASCYSILKRKKLSGIPFYYLLHTSSLNSL